MSKLILLTKHYPFGTGEEFIEGEVDELSSLFENLTIIACQVPYDSEQTRTVSDNVNVIRINVSNSAIRKLFYCISGLRGLFDSDVRKELHSAKSFMAKGAVFYYLGKVCSIYSKVYSAVKDNASIKEGSTIIYSYWLYDTADIAIRLRDSGIFGKKSIAVSRGHGYDVYSERNSANWIPFQADRIRKLDLSLICSNDGRDYLRARYPDQQDKIQTSYLGTADFGLGCSVSNDQFHLVTCSWLAPLKRLDLLIDALVIAQQRHKNKLKWTCIGSGELLDHYKDRAENELKHMEIVMTGALTKAQLYKYYSDNSVDLFVNVSESEGLPVSIMEAQSFGIPSLATDAGGTREITINGSTGLLIPVKSTAVEIADALDFFLTMPSDKKNEYRMKCRSTWEEYFNSKTNYRRFAKQIKELLGE